MKRKKKKLCVNVSEYDTLIQIDDDGSRGISPFLLDDFFVVGYYYFIRIDFFLPPTSDFLPIA